MNRKIAVAALAGAALMAVVGPAVADDGGLDQGRGRDHDGAHSAGEFPDSPDLPEFPEGVDEEADDSAEDNGLIAKPVNHQSNFTADLAQQPPL
ncbi:hypothetical protein [Streptomyces sp. NPDC090025]|uniref:hypothetical protein n=1 Tax=Streptomyces sp. NPDC090025 TaxID=3365922 RepID=UPI00383374E1